MARNEPREDLASMSLEDHLEELRARIILAFIGLAVGTVFGFIFSPYVIDFIQKPYVNAVQKLYGADTAEEIEKDDAEVTAQPHMQALGPAEGFISYVKVAVITGLLLASPWIFYQLWMFVAAGLYPHEKQYVYWAIPFSVALFIGGALFFMFVVAPLTFKFLLKINESLGLRSDFRFSEYISFIVHLMLVFGIAFQTPTAIFFLNRTGLVELDSLRRSRKYVMLGIVILAAMATPPDVVSQVALAIPLYILFELGIVLSYISMKRAQKE